MAKYSLHTPGRPDNNWALKPLEVLSDAYGCAMPVRNHKPSNNPFLTWCFSSPLDMRWVLQSKLYRTDDNTSWERSSWQPPTHREGS